MLTDVLIYLLATVIAVPLFKRFGLGAVLGYLVAGVIIGPAALKLVGNAQSVLHFAEFGVVLLLFLVGLELNPKKLWALRVSIFGTGTVQLIATAGLVFLMGRVFGVDWRIAMVAGICIGVRINDNIGNHCMIICATVHPPVHRIGYIHVLFMCDDGSCMGVGRRASLMCIDYVTHQWQCCVSGW